MQSSTLKRILIGSTIGLFVVIDFGVLWLLFAAPSNPEGFGWYLFAFAAGLSMIVLPCTLPLAFVIVPLSMGKGVTKGVGTALFFGLGVVVTLSLYGIAAALVGKAAIGSLGAPLELVKNWVYFIAGIFAYTFALAEVGLAKFHMPTYKGAAPAFIQKQQDFFKAFLLGLFLGNIGVGCPHPATPLILIEIASSGDVLYGWTLFMVHAIGRILPLLLLAFLGVMGVNGLKWLVARKDKVEKVTGWAMVFVAGFIMTLGLFTHKWWVNSGIHSYLEKITQEEALLNIVKDNLNSAVTHAHGLDMGVGLFGLPLSWGSTFMVLLWVIPLWIWWRREKRKALEIPAEQMTSEKEARLSWVSAREWFLVSVTALLVLIFIYVLPHNFQFHISGDDDHGSAMSSAKTYTYFSRDVTNLPDAKPSLTVELKDKAAYTLIAGYVAKEINGKKVRMLAYNGSVPGPFLKVSEGSTIYINFVNNTDLNQTIHSHGVRLSNANDGVPDVTQPTVRPGQKFSYTITFPDPGVFWYHPHTRDDYGQELGLYGNYLVSFKDKKELASVNKEVPLIIDDILLDSKGDIAPFAHEGINRTLSGRIGNVMLINGDSNYSLDVKKGEIVRFFITNASNARIYNLTLTGARLKLIGSDDSLYSHEEYVENILLSPSERAIVEAYFPDAGTYLLRNETPKKLYRLGMFTVGSESVKNSYVEEFNIRKTHSIGLPDSFVEKMTERNPDKRLKLTVLLTGDASMHDHSNHGGPTSFLFNTVEAHGTGVIPKGILWEDDMEMMNEMTNSENTFWKIVDMDTNMENEKISWAFEKGSFVKIRIWNDKASQHPMQHPVHFHGNRFAVLTEDGVQNQNLVWKDTVLIPTGSTYDILLDASNVGTWMAHCHISEHLHAGMMFSYRILEKGDPLLLVKPVVKSSSQTPNQEETASHGEGMNMQGMNTQAQPFDESLPHGHDADGSSVRQDMHDSKGFDESLPHGHDADGSSILPGISQSGPAGFPKSAKIFISLLLMAGLSFWVRKLILKP
ncbi:MAG: multicopper oxidase domain-containing protein [Patescibacteria group bacterium]